VIGRHSGPQSHFVRILALFLEHCLSLSSICYLYSILLTNAIPTVFIMLCTLIFPQTD
jgi:hypothetical protein